jgi:hypothetical protein
MEIECFFGFYVGRYVNVETGGEGEMVGRLGGAETGGMKTES